MAWNEETLMERKHRFVSLAATGRFTFTELCADFGEATNRQFACNGRGELTAGIGYLGTNVTIQAADRLPECHRACDGNFTRKNEP